MRPLLTSASASVLAAVIAALTLPALTPSAKAASGVIRCAMPDGTHVYGNKACSSFGATSASLPSELHNRIAAEQRREVRITAERQGIDPAAALAALDARRTLPATATATAPRPAQTGCAASPRQLATDLQASVAAGDVNRVAESFDWAGMRNAEAQRIMDRLDRMADRAVVDAEYFDAQLGLAMADGNAGDAGMMQVTFHDDGATSVDDFEVRKTSGCYFLRYA